LFEQVATTITEEYVDDMMQFIQMNGYTPSFTELVQRMHALRDDLTLRATWIKEDYRKDRGRRSVKLTTGCKKIINKAVEEYLRRSRTIIAIKSQPSFSASWMEC
jgi:hypothetical protein